MRRLLITLALVAATLAATPTADASPAVETAPARGDGDPRFATPAFDITLNHDDVRRIPPKNQHMYFTVDFEDDPRDDIRVAVQDAQPCRQGNRPWLTIELWEELPFLPDGQYRNSREVQCTGLVEWQNVAAQRYYLKFKLGHGYPESNQGPYHFLGEFRFWCDAGSCFGPPEGAGGE